MAKVYVSAVIEAPIEAVWNRIRDFNGLPDWHPAFSRSHIEGGLPSDKIGCIRNFDLKDGGGTIRERLLTLSDLDHTFTYCILDAPLAVKDYVATCTLYPITVGDKTLGVWTAEFIVTKGTDQAMIDQIGNGVFGLAFSSLNAHFAKK